DKLQDAVPATISLLREAGIKIWVLTGDKVETAINIGFATNLLHRDMQIVSICGAADTAAADAQMAEALDAGRPKNSTSSTASTPPPPQMALVIDGPSLHAALSTPRTSARFLRLATRSASVICCRASPKQKAQVVRLVKKAKLAMCLSVGDGANDVAMIQEAHVGVGIAGKEGVQAAMAADYVIARFGDLRRLILVHGRWCYYRTSNTVLNFFYKNMTWVFVLFWYQIYCGFTADILYDYTFLMFYNLLFTSLPPLFLGVFDQDIQAKYALAYPQLYRAGISRSLFTMRRFWGFVADAVLQSFFCFFAGRQMWDTAAGNGTSADKEILGTSVAVYVIVTVNLFVGFNTRRWTFMTFLVVFGSIAVFFAYIPIWSQFKGSSIYKIEKRLYRSSNFWLGIPPIVIANLLPRYFARAVQTMLWPTDLDIVRERAKYG
ncbi:HAD-like domain-containing protein, partial [Blyttiomyces helicus]